MTRRHVAILLATHNGARFLSEQIESLAAQTHSHWTIFASDDGSTDDTYAILEKHQKQLGANRLVVMHGARQGTAANFLALLRRPEILADYFAYCDQDDIWLPNRLERGIHWCTTISETTPALFCGRTRLIDENNTSIGASPLCSRLPSFQNALAQNIASGNTMLFNQAARRLLMKTENFDDVVIHDWWTYLLISACGGRVFYDAEPTVLYRQHTDNQIGVGTGWTARLARLTNVLKGRDREWNTRHLRALVPFIEHMPAENRKTLSLFEQARAASFFRRIALFSRSGVHGQNALGNLRLWLTVLLNKI